MYVGRYCYWFRVTIWNGDSDANFTMPHQVLQRFRIHACFRLITAIGMAADVRRDVWHLYPVNLVVLADHAIEAMLPVQGDQRHTVLVEVQEAAVAVNERFPSWHLPVFNDRLKAPGYLFGDWNLPLSGIGLSGLDHILHIGSALKLVVDVDHTVLQVNVPERQSAEFGNTHPGMKQDVDRFVVFAVSVVIVNESQELAHLFTGDGFSGLAVVDHHACKLESEGVLDDDIIIDRHLESRSQNTTHRFDCAVTPAVALQLNQKQFCI